jgi:hypothetical protein
MILPKRMTARRILTVTELAILLLIYNKNHEYYLVHNGDGRTIGKRMTLK